jgi:serine/threonine protein kinase
MTYPSIQQYQEALQHPATAFTDPVLATGKIAVSGLGVPRVLSGGFALTYAVEVGGRKYAARCFHREAKGLERRYEAISKKLKSLASPYFLDFEYQPKGVRIGGSAFPVVKMAWANGETLGEFVENNHGNVAKVKNLLTSLGQLASYLEQTGIAHGDIQDLNLVVTDDGRKIQLIDYDGMFVPELASLGGSELGHRDYQHPQRDAKKYDSTLDRFSFIALNLALRALCEKPSLWRTSQSGAGVIVFRANDYADPGSSAVVAEVAAIPALARDAKNFEAICGAEFGVVPTLAHFATASNIPRAVAQLKPRSTTVTRAAAPVGYISAYPVLNATDYAAFEKGIGQMVELIGKVVEVKVDRTRGGKPYIFVNFGHWRGNTVKINVWNEALSKGGEHPSEVWVGRWVTMRGLVEPVYANKKFNYQHISITANAVTQISQLTEAEAKYRLSAPRTPITRAATSSVASNNSAVLDLLRGSSPTATPPMASGGQHHPTHSSASRNQSILQSMKGSTSSTRPAPPQRSAANSSTRGAAPSPSPFKQHTPTKQTPSGLLGWLAGLFK